MLKIKCVYIYPADHQPLPTKKEMEKQYGAKVLYGLGKYKTITPAVGGIYSVEHIFATVRHMFKAPAAYTALLPSLVAFDDSIDGTWFSLATQLHILTKFTVDEQTIDQMHDLNSSIALLQEQDRQLQCEIMLLQSYREKEIGDQQFIDCVCHHQAEVHAFSSEVQRMVDVYTARLAALFSSGW